MTLPRIHEVSRVMLAISSSIPKERFISYNLMF
nr:MAG TPA: hypothetical protein [Herelleviridae sp.]